MNENILTNVSLIRYYNLVRGTNKTRLTPLEVLSIGVQVNAFDVLPKGTNGFHWTDGLIDLHFNGNDYISFPDIIKDSLPTYSEEKGVSNNAISFKVSSVNDSVRALALGGFLKDSQFNIYMVILNPYDSSVIESTNMFTGFLDTVQATYDPIAGKNEMEIRVNSIYKKLDRTPALIAANGVYQSYYPGDAYFSLLGSVNQDQIWRK